MNIRKRFLPIAVSALLLTATATPVWAADNASEKEEVVYIMADASGAVGGVYVVNTFGSGEITDYGDYSEVKMLNTDDPVTRDGDMITFTTNADRVYYQGTLKDTHIPWNISIRYFIDGEEYTTSEIAGKSGQMEIRFKITQNEEFTGNFYDKYALQAAFLLSTEKCSNISAPDATIADVGSDKQLTYTILPGKGIDTSIMADVTDFTMDAVAINGIQLNLNVEIDDTELMDQIADLNNGIPEIDDGASSLYDGTADLREGGSSLVDGASSLDSGINDLDDGIETLKAGIASVQKGLTSLRKKSDDLVSGSSEVKAALATIQSSLAAVSVSTDDLTALTAASGAIKSGISDLYDGVALLRQNLGYAQYKAMMAQNGLDIDTLKQNNTQTVTDLTAQISNLQATLSQIEGVPGNEEQAAELQIQINTLQNMVTLLTANNAAIGGTESYLSGFHDLVETLYAGVSGLKSNYAAFDASISDLANTLSGMVVNLSALASGIDELAAKYDELDTGIGEYTDGVAKLAAGYKDIIAGVNDLSEGSKKLVNGSMSLCDGAADLYDGTVSLDGGAKELSDGTSKMRDETSDMDTQVQDKIDEMLASIQSTGTETVSFVSEKNTNVDSVQFVIKTEAITKAKKSAPKNEAKENTTFWQKLLNLFGVN